MKKYKRYLLIPIIIIGVFVFVILFTKIFWTETFNWKSTVTSETKNTIRGLTFNPIDYRYFDGFAGKNIAQKYSECKNVSNVKELENLLKVEGGECMKYFSLEYTNNDGIKTVISNKDELFRVLGPIDSERKSVAFLYSLWPDLKYTNNGELVGSVAKVEDGYIIKAFKNNTFGCGKHYPSESLFKVSLNGDVENIANINELFVLERLTLPGSTLCVD